MSDPLRLINTGGANRAMSPMGPLTGPGAQRPGGPGDPNQPNFAQTLIGKIEEVNKLQNEAAKAAEDFAVGDRQDLEGVLLATQKADTAFRMLLALRNKVQAAYDEVKQVRI